MVSENFSAALVYRHLYSDSSKSSRHVGAYHHCRQCRQELQCYRLEGNNGIVEQNKTFLYITA